MLESKIIHSFQRGSGSVTMAGKFRQICLKCSLLGLFMLFLQPVFSQADWNDLDAQLKVKQKQLGTDFVVMVWKGDTIVHKKEMGGFNSKTQAAIGGSSKWLTAALVMVMVDEGKISLDDKISTYLPVFAKYGKNYITLRLCLTHMTGIEDEGKKLFQRTIFSSLEDKVNSYAAREIRANPGEDVWFGNMGCDIAARVLEVVSKKKFDVLIKQKLFNQLSMRRTTFSTLDASLPDPSNGAMTTPDDFMQFLGMMLNKGKYKGKQVLSEASINELMKVGTKTELIKYAPKALHGYNFAPGSVVFEENNGKATVLASPGLSGTWPMVDYCHGYAYLVMTKTPVTDEKPEEYLQLKKLVDQQAPSTCQ